MSALQTSTPVNGTYVSNGVAYTPTKSDAGQYGRKLRDQTIACRVSHERMGVKKALTHDQVADAAEVFDASPNALSAMKKLIDTRNGKYRAVVGVRSAATKYWKAMTVPYPDTGIRLLRRDRLDEFNKQMETFRDQLRANVHELQAEYAYLITEARDRLGTLFNEQDYPPSVIGRFSLEWDFPSIDPPAYLKKLHPALYEQESQRIAARFDEAVSLTETAFIEQFQKLVSHLAERLAGEVDGKPKVFHDTSVKNLQEFFEQFKSLSIGSSGELEKLIETAQQAVAGVDPGKLRESSDLREHVAQKLGEVQQTLDAFMIARPKRKITLEPETNSEGTTDGQV